MRRKWSKEIVVLHIQKLHRDGEKLNLDCIRKNNNSLLNAASLHWGGWRQAIEAAGIPYVSVKLKRHSGRKTIWTNHAVVAAIHARYKRGEKINCNTVFKEESGLYGGAVRRFGTWTKALTAANLIHTLKKRNEWSKEKIIARIHELRNKDVRLNNHNIKNNHSILYTVSCQYFGSWGHAVESSGISYDSVRRIIMRYWSKEKIVQEIIRRIEVGYAVGGKQIQIEDPGLYDAAMLHFGKKGWAQARCAAGLPSIDPRPNVIVDKQVVIDNLKALHARGEPLNFGALSGKPYQNIVTAAMRLFGTYTAALAAAGIDYDSEIRKQRHGWWTKERILEELKFLEVSGVRLSHYRMQKSHSGLVAAALREFDTWEQALTTAGINYRKHRLALSIKRWAERMSDKKYNEVQSNPTRKQKNGRSR